MSRVLTAHRETWPLERVLTISRGSRTATKVVVAVIDEDGARGRGECVPYPHYGESVASVVDEIESVAGEIREGVTATELQALLPPGAARNAVDCALWDLAAKRSGRPVWELAGTGEPTPLLTAYTLSLGTPDEMGAAAAEHRNRPLLKLKLGAQDPVARVRAVRGAAPDARLIVDANEGWNGGDLEALLSALEPFGVELVEQPLPAGADAALGEIERAVPVAADESCHIRDDLEAIRNRYDVINIKLDKTGGLTEALLLEEKVISEGLDVMIGCMVGTSLGMAPAHLLGGRARFVDLDGPLLLAEDRPHPLRFEGGRIHPPSPELWG